MSHTRKFNLSLLIVGTAASLMMFQNCGQMQFSKMATASSAPATGGGASSEAEHTTSGIISGKVTEGPIMPHCIVDVPCDGPYANSDLFLFQCLEGEPFTEACQLVKTFQTDEAGQFRVSAEPGHYFVSFYSDGDGGGLIRFRGGEPVEVNVTGVDEIILDIFFDTGIR